MGEGGEGCESGKSRNSAKGIHHFPSIFSARLSSQLVLLMFQSRPQRLDTSPPLKTMKTHFSLKKRKISASFQRQGVSWGVLVQVSGKGYVPGRLGVAHQGLKPCHQLHTGKQACWPLGKTHTSFRYPAIATQLPCEFRFLTFPSDLWRVCMRSCRRPP